VVKLKDAEHLLRLADVFAGGLVLFLVLRAFYIPKSFGQYGHYRGNAIKEVAARPISFAGHQACEDCHADVAQSKHAGKHAGVNCEACHGPLAAHADDPAGVTPQLPDTLVLCPRCHEANLAKPKAFPQVDTKDHMGDVPCKSCHQPHNPALAPEEKPGKEGKKS
jgi:hypothetical protein